MNNLIESARAYLGVRFRHRGRNAHGLDCAGLVVVSYRDCGCELLDFTLYGREPYRDGLIEHVTAALGQPLDEHDRSLNDGDVIVMRFDKEPHHLALVCAVDYAGMPAFNIIHADGHVGRVIEQRLALDIAARITHVYRKGVL